MDSRLILPLALGVTATLMLISTLVNSPDPDFFPCQFVAADTLYDHDINTGIAQPATYQPSPLPDLPADPSYCY